LASLEGVEHFKQLTHLSVSFNRIADIEELSRVAAPAQLECLAVKGNYFIERNPNYSSLLLNHFTNLKELDSLQVA